VNGLQSLRRPEEVAKIRGKAVADVLPYKAPEAETQPEPAATEPEASAEVAEETPSE
jgi:hypothetical protein